MRKQITLLLLFIPFFGIISFAQERSTAKAYIKFQSEIGGIYAENSTVTSKLNISTGNLFFLAKIEGFIFKNSLMQKHYNEADMMHSEKYPKATFSGKIVNNSKVNYSKEGTYKISVKGKLMIKGVSKELEATGTIQIKDGKIFANTTFSIDRHNYNVTGNEESVSQILKITVKAEY